MGWNQVKYADDGTAGAAGRRCPIFEGIPEGTYFYFVHSYYVEPENASVAAGITDYGAPFVSAIWRDNIFATQFHPEKSQEAGLKLIENFGKLVTGDLKLARTEVRKNESAHCSPTQTKD
jgi:glutamine amidotransferase